nr:RNA-directed DNA polymerase, eukaryota [Tanacetum cinerariifolium]
FYTWSRETFVTIGKKWGETLDLEDNTDISFGRKRVCIKTKHATSILESFKIIVKDLDNGLVLETNILRRLELKRKLLNINDMESKDNIQKSKVTWAIEGDENLKFFHGIINKKRSQLAIRGIFVDGFWCIDPGMIKKTFFNHFEARFKEPGTHRFKINFQFSRKLVQSQADESERVKYWDLIGSNLCEAVEYFFVKGSFPKGCNSSFIALIPKVLDAKFVSDFWPISLIGCVYKVVTKILANRLMKVISDLVSDTQSTFVAGRQILDGPFILDELVQWCKRRNKQAMFLRIKAWESVILNLRSCLSKWKVKTLSIGGRLTLLKSVLGASPIYCMSIFKVPRGVLKVMKAICSRFFNGVMVGECSSRLKAWDDTILKLKSRLSKWKVKTLSIGGRLTLLKSVIRALYGPLVGSHRTHYSSNWCSIMREVHKLKDKGFDFWSHVKKQIGNRADTSFWSECWLGDIPLRVKYPRLFALEMDKEASVESKLHSLMESSFRRNVRGGIEQHLLVELTSMLESVSLLNSCDRWICVLTSDGNFRVTEVNVFTWRARQDCLPTRVNLVRRGINVESCVCPVCSSGEEDINHTLFRCDLAQQVTEFLAVPGQM